MKSFLADLPEGHGSVYKEVRFSPTATPLRRAQSLSAAGPGRSSYERPTIFERTRPVMDTSFIDQSHDLLKKQQKHFQAERELFDHERQLWERERSLLRSRIEELETLVNARKGRTGTRAARAPSFGLPQYQGSDASLHTAQVWEGSSPGTLPTRVFKEGDVPENSQLSPLIEGLKAPSLDAALSPKSSSADVSVSAVSVPVPIEKLDSKLDGITLKSTALPAGVVARVITPPSLSSQDPSPSGAPLAAARPEIEHRNSLKLKLSELGPPNENLVRHAGHTPMAIFEADSSQRSTQEATPHPEPQELVPEEEEEAPLAPVATHVPLPTENAESYFPDVPDDPALTGPLGLTNDEEHDSSFLNALDQKLLDQARRILSTSTEESADAEEEPEAPNPGEKEPELKFKNSTNFGTAFGAT